MALAHECNTVRNNQTSHPAKKTWWGKFVNWFRQMDLEQGQRLQEMRGMLSIASTMISTITFQSSINPPGGVFQPDDAKTVEQLLDCYSNMSIPCPGGAIMANVRPYEYYNFQLYNTISFIASLSVTLLLVSGIPLNNIFLVWMLSIGMIITLTFLALTYLLSLRAQVDFVSWTDNGVFTIVTVSIWAWVALVGIIGLLLTVRFVVWLVDKYRRFKQSKSTNQAN